MKNFDNGGAGFKETAWRAARTFLQAAAGYVAANVTLFAVDDGSTLKRALVGLVASAVACGLAAVMNLPGRGGDPGICSVGKTDQ